MTIVMLRRISFLREERFVWWQIVFKGMHRSQALPTI
jgi:hypothetical protein